MPSDALKALVLSGSQYASTDGATSGTGSRTQVAYVIRINPSADPGKTDSNSEVYRDAIENLNLSFQANDVISRNWQLQFGMANSPNDLNAFVPIAAGAQALIIFVLHGDPGNNDSKLAFGEQGSPAYFMNRWNKAAGVDYLNSNTSRFISCDEDVGARPPSWQTKNRIAPILEEYFTRLRIVKRAMKKIILASVVLSWCSFGSAKEQTQNVATIDALRSYADNVIVEQIGSACTR